MKAGKSKTQLNEPLLHASQRQEQQNQQQQCTDTFWPCAFNLAKVVTGAGMMAVPRAYLQVGWLLGTVMLLGVADLTYFTLAVLVHGSATTGAATYSQLVRVTCGRLPMKVLQLSVLSFCFGFSVVYLVVIRDILLGSPPHCNGLLCELLGLNPSGPLADPRLVIAAVALLICAPLLLLRSMDSLACLNVVGLAAVVLLAAVAALLGVSAVARGTAHAIPMMPQWHLLGPRKAVQLEAMAGVLPVILASYVVHQNLHPAMPLLRPYTPSRMCGVVAIALAISASVFVALSVGSSLVFGIDQLETNVLNNFSAEDLAPVVGHLWGDVVSCVIRGGYLVSVLGSLLLYMYPLRSCLAEVIWGAGSAQVEMQESRSFGGRDGAETSSCVMCEESSVRSSSIESVDAAVVLSLGSTGSWTDAAETGQVPVARHLHKEQQEGEVSEDITGAHGHVAVMQQEQHQQPRWQRLEQQWYYSLTYGLLVSMVLVAVVVPSIWSALSLIGDLACTTQAFMLPGAIALVLAFKYGLGNFVSKAATATQAVGGSPSSTEVAAAAAAATAAAATGAAVAKDCVADVDQQAGQQLLGESCDDACGKEVQPSDEVVLVMSPLQYPLLLRLGSRRSSSMLELLQGPRQQRRSLEASASMSAVQHVGCFAAAGGVAYVVLSGFVVLLGMALFANGLWQRV